MKITGNEPVYPVVNADGFCTSFENIQGPDAGAIGLTIRQHFAAVAMQGILATESDMNYKAICTQSVICADMLIAELNKE